MRRGQLNQKRSSPGLTRGVPRTTSPFSWNLRPIFVMITCSFVPTIKMIYKNTMFISRRIQFSVGPLKLKDKIHLIILELKVLTINGTKGSQR